MNKTKLVNLSTNGFDYYSVIYKLCDGSIINVHINDTCGQERYNSIWEKYYKKADGILLVYDISSKPSFEKIANYYVEKIRDNCKKGIPIILLGNKTDLEDKREVTKEEAIDLSISQEFIFKESSCLKDENVADAFETIFEMWNINNKKNFLTPKENNEEKDINENKSSFSLSTKDFKNKKTTVKKSKKNQYFVNLF